MLLQCGVVWLLSVSVVGVRKWLGARGCKEHAAEGVQTDSRVSAGCRTHSTWL